MASNVNIAIADSKRFYTLSELALLIGVTPACLRLYAARGLIPAQKLGMRPWIVLAEDLPQVKAVFPTLEIPDE